MSLNPTGLADALAENAQLARVVIAAAKGSAPRGVGTSMLVTASGQSGTIGGGALEWQAADLARKLLAAGRQAEVVDCPLGPALGQCCGGHVTLVIERVTEAMLADQPAFARRVTPDAPETPPLPIARALRAARHGQAIATKFADGWLVEPTFAPRMPLWLYGAGHVGRAVVRVLEDLPFSLTWVDDAQSRFPDGIPAHADMLVASNPADAVAHAPDNAAHIVLTYSHAQDLEICHRVLSRPFAHLGLIGSATKKARFLKRLAALGHSEATLSRLECPIGDPALGKAPGAIAIGLAYRLLDGQSSEAAGAACPNEARQ